MAKLFIAMFKNNPPIIHFLVCPKWHIVKQVPFSSSQLTSNTLVIFSCPYNRHMMQPHLPSNYLIIIFQIFCPERSFVKEVQARHLKMSCNFASTLISSYYSPPPKLSSFNASMWSHLQFFDSVQNFSLWSKYILSCSITAGNFYRPSSIHITSLHPFWTHFIKPLFL